MTTSREEVRRQRRERMEARQQSERQAVRRRARQRTLRMGGIVGGGVVLAGALLFVVLRELFGPLPGEAVPLEGRGHVPPGSVLSHRASPPASGTHYTSTARWGFSNQPVEPGFWIHNLEHGGIVILYKCPEDCQELEEQLRGLPDRFPRWDDGRPMLVVAPSREIDNTIMALAWTRRQAFDSFDEGALRRFFDALARRGPEPGP